MQNQDQDHDIEINDAEIAELLNKYLESSSPGLSILNDNPSTLSILAFPRGELHNYVHAGSRGHRDYAFRAIAYSITAWVYELQVPRSSSRVIAKMQTGLPRQPAERIQEMHALWGKTSKRVMELLAHEAASTELEEAELKALFKAVSQGNEQKLCEALLRGFESQLPQRERIDWIYQYSIPFGC